MSSSELAAAYRLHGAHCIAIAQTSDVESKLVLLDMAQAWLRLAEQAFKNDEAVLVYETPVPRGS
jgi:hypothetical protein